MWYCPVPTIPFTERTLQSLKPLPRTVEYYDTKTSGLSVRVLPTGKKTFYFVYRSASASAAAPGRPLVRLKVGRESAVYPAAARAGVRSQRGTTSPDSAP